jgi:hypothetical protein
MKMRKTLLNTLAITAITVAGSIGAAKAGQPTPTPKPNATTVNTTRSNTFRTAATTPTPAPTPKAKTGGIYAAPPKPPTPAKAKKPVKK